MGGESVCRGSANGLILTSTDGLYWQVQRPIAGRLGRTHAPCLPHLRSIAWGNGRFIASGEHNELSTII
jgi:hypothetical protein